MFEKEAEEYCMNQSLLEDVRDNICNAFEYGAEFGYNKANEWHYMKDVDLPPLNINVLVIHKWHKIPEVGKRITVFTNSSKWVWAMCCDRYRYTSDDKNVIAWKEIVLPKESL